MTDDKMEFFDPLGELQKVVDDILESEKEVQP